MNQDSLLKLIMHGLSAMKAGSNVATKATSEIQQNATDPALKEVLEQGSQQSGQWAEHIERALVEIGGKGDEKNLILEAQYKVSKQIRENAEDDLSRDLGIIASGQMALHYWISSFGTMQAYAEQLGLEQTASSMETCLEEAKAADVELTDIATEIMGSQTQKAREIQTGHMRMQ